MQTETKKKPKMKREEFLINLAFGIIGLFLVSMGLTYLFAGLHNIDLVNNMVRLEEGLGIELMDYTNKGELVDGYESVVMGTNQIMMSPFMMLAGAFLFGRLTR